MGVFVWDTVEDPGSWENDRMYEIFGRTREEWPINGAAFMSEVVHPDYRGGVQASHGAREFRSGLMAKSSIMKE
jgi:hypothetical protein